MADHAPNARIQEILPAGTLPPLTHPCAVRHLRWARGAVWQRLSGKGPLLGDREEVEVAGAKVYDWMYRNWAPWDSVGVRQDLVDLLDRGDITPERYPRSIDLGCGTGANVVYLSQQGFDSWGVDFSRVAIEQAKQRAASAGVEANLVLGDFTAEEISGVEGQFDLLVDFGVLDDLRREDRQKMAATINRLSRPGSKFLEYCFYTTRRDLFWAGMSLVGMRPLLPGDLEALFAREWKVEPFASYPDWRAAAFVLTRRA